MRSGRIVFLTPPKQFLRQLELSEMTDYFEFYDSETDAREALARSR